MSRAITVSRIPGTYFENVPTELRTELAEYLTAPVVDVKVAPYISGVDVRNIIINVLTDHVRMTSVYMTISVRDLRTFLYNSEMRSQALLSQVTNQVNASQLRYDNGKLYLISVFTTEFSEEVGDILMEKLSLIH